MRGEFLSELKVAGLGPLWKRAPFVLRHFPAVLAAVLCSAFVLGLAASANSLFYASESSAVLAKQLSGQDRWAGGLQVTTYGNFGGAGAAANHAHWNDLLQTASARLSGLGTLNLSIVGTQVQVSGPASDRLAFSQLLTRPRALQHVQVLKRGGSQGVWLAATNARYLDLSVGDRIRLEVEGASASHPKNISVPVAGIYQDIATSSILDAFWVPLQDGILPPYPGAQVPPPWMITPP